MNNLTRGAIALLLLASTAAGADQQYPAADFQPEVVYQDSDYIAKNSPATTAAKTTTTPTSNATPIKEVDSKYPAADFQPEVLYHDPNYKPTQSVRATISKSDVGSKQEESVKSTAASKEESSMSTY
jgi:hypothetical protein